MSPLVEHAERELKAAGLFDKDSDYGGMIGEAVMKLVRAHSLEGHSGFSHQLTIQAFNKVINFENLTPIKKEDFVEVTPGLWQCKRNFSLFSKDGGETHYDINCPVEVPVETTL